MAKAKAKTTKPSENKSKVINQVIATGVAVVLVMILSIALWAKNNIYNSDRFSDQLVAAVQKEDVRLAIGSEVADKIYEGKPVLQRVLASPTQSVVASLLNNDKFANILDTLATKVNEKVVNGKNNDVVIDISGFTTTINSIATAISPDSNLTLPQGDDARITVIKAESIPNLQPPGRVMLMLAPFAAIALFVLLIVGWIKNKNKLEFIKLCGIGAIVSGGLLLILTSTVGSQLALSAANANQTTILNSIYSEFTASFNTYQSWLIALGLVDLLFVYLIKRKDLIVGLSNKLRKNK